MGPKQRRGIKVPVSVGPRPASSGEESPDADALRLPGVSQDFEAFVRATLSKLVEGQRQLEAQLGASIEFNSERISGLEKAKEVTENNVKNLQVRVFAVQEQLDSQQADINKQ